MRKYTEKKLIISLISVKKVLVLQIYKDIYQDIATCKVLV